MVPIYNNNFVQIILKNPKSETTIQCHADNLEMVLDLLSESDLTYFDREIVTIEE